MNHPEENSGATVRLLWSRVIWRHWKSDFKLTAVLVGILSLGVAVFLAVHLANKAAVAGFGIFKDSISGESDLLIRPRAGFLDDELLGEIRERSGSLPVGIFPVLEASAVDQFDSRGVLFQLVGADLVGLQNAVHYTDGASTPPILDGTVEILGRPDRGFISEALARKRKLETGDTLPLFVNDRAVDLAIAGVLKNDPLRPSVPEEMIVMDLPGLQELANQKGRLSRIELRVSPGAGYERNLEKLKAILSQNDDSRYAVDTPQTRRDSVTTMGAGFRLNLNILSTLALLVGTYLILQAMEAAVIKRRSEIAIMRALGVTPKEIRLSWLLESLILGTVGSALGVVLGWLMAGSLVGAISQTVNTLYYRTTTASITPGLLEISFSMGFGILACLVAAFIPAREAASTPPALTMKSGSQKGGLSVLRNVPLGIGFLIAAAICALLPAYETGNGRMIPVAGYLSALFFVLGGSIVSGILFRPLSKILRGNGKKPLRSYAASQFRKAEGRHRLAAAGLAVAIGMSAAMGILVASFDTTLKNWIGHLLKADVYVSAPGTTSVANENTISSATWKSVEAMPEVDGLDTMRRYNVIIEGKEALLGGSEYNRNSDRYLQLMWLQRPTETGPAALTRKQGESFPAWVNESFVRKYGKEKGDSFSLATPNGKKLLRIEGVFADYGSETGVVIVSRQFTSEWFGDESISQMAVYAKPGTDHTALAAQIRENHPSLFSRTNAKLRAESLQIFHQTFSVTYALEMIAVIIAVTGLGLALVGLLLERAGELETLKSLGATRKEIAGATAWEGVGLAMVGLAAGFFLSLVLGWLLIYVINPQSFGWTLQFSVPWKSLTALALLTLATAAAVAWTVGYRNARLRSDRFD